MIIEVTNNYQADLATAITAGLFAKGAKPKKAVLLQAIEDYNKSTVAASKPQKSAGKTRVVSAKSRATKIKQPVEAAPVAEPVAVEPTAEPVEATPVETTSKKRGKKAAKPVEPVAVAEPVAVEPAVEAEPVAVAAVETVIASQPSQVKPSIAETKFDFTELNRIYDRYYGVDAVPEVEQPDKISLDCTTEHCEGALTGTLSDSFERILEDESSERIHVWRNCSCSECKVTHEVVFEITSENHGYFVTTDIGCTVAELEASATRIEAPKPAKKAKAVKTPKAAKTAKKAKSDVPQTEAEKRLNTGCKGDDRAKLIALLKKGATRAQVEKAMGWTKKNTQNHMTYVKWWGYGLVREGDVYRIVSEPATAK